MRELKKYKIIICILSLAVVVEGIFIIMLVRSKKPPKIPAGIKGEIAIVLDDWGYNLNNLAALDEIKYPITASVLPHLAYTDRVVEELKKRGLEVILHLPMEPREQFRLEKNTIMVSFDQARIINILAQDLESVRYAKGVSNHMGSKATQDAKTMESLFRELKKRHLYFLDSLVSPASVCAEITRKMHVGFARRDIFLDNQEDAGYIKGQLYKLKQRARMQGEAIGIGHDRKNTLEVLKEVMPELEREGYRFVFVSELVR